MKVKTAQPLTIDEMIKLTGKDALYQIGPKEMRRSRIMNATYGQEIDVDVTVYDRITGIKWGLRRVNKPDYGYLAFRIQF